MANEIKNIRKQVQFICDCSKYDDKTKSKEAIGKLLFVDNKDEKIYDTICKKCGKEVSLIMESTTIYYES